MDPVKSISGHFVTTYPRISGLTAVPSKASFVDAGMGRLHRLCEATGLESRIPLIVDIFQRLLEPWGQLPIGSRPWPSEVGDDHTPYEFSVAFGGKPELRILVEPLGDPPSLTANRDVAMNVIRDLGRDCDITLARLSAIEDLFLPGEPQGSFSLWLAVSFWLDRAPELKIYLNPEAQGVSRSSALVEEALVRLGFPRSWPVLSRSMARRGEVLDELKYFSIDMAPRTTSRVKVYARHLDATADDFERASAPARSHIPGETAAFVRAMGGPEVGACSGRPPATCFSFVEGHDEPLAVTHHFPVNGGYADDDAVVAQRVSEYMRLKGLPADDYQKVLQAIATRPLSDGIGIQSYASFRRDQGRPRLTVYFPPELFEAGTIASASVRAAPNSREGILERLASEPFTDHPVFGRLRREPVDLGRVKAWLVNAIAAVGVDADGFDELHVELLRIVQDRLEALARRPELPGLPQPEAVAPGRAARERFDQFLAVCGPSVAAGGLWALDYFSRQLALFVYGEIQRSGNTEPMSMPESPGSLWNWPALALAFAKTDPAELWQGARAVSLALALVSDAMYEQFYTPGIGASEA